MKINQITAKKTKQFIIFLLCVFSIFLALVPPVMNTFAKEETNKEKIEKGYDKYAGDNKDLSEVTGNKLAGGKTSDKSYNIQKRENTFMYVFARTIIPGYMNDVKSYSPPKDGWDKSVFQGTRYMCHHNAPSNLVGFNCDIPNISSQVLQSVIRVFMSSGIENGQRKSAQPFMGLGTPKSIPGGAVPLASNSRSAKYTGLELFGYNMNWTNYKGEWDDIMPSSNARALANYGSMDKLKVAQSAIWNGVKSGASKFIDEASINPLTWFGAARKALEAGSSSTLLTVIDTSDANVAATHAWLRSGNSVASSFYRVYTLSDRQVTNIALNEETKEYARIINSLLGKDPSIKKIMDKETPPTFTYKKELNDAFKKKKAKAEDEAAAAKAYNDKHPDDKKPVPKIPSPTKDDYKTENEEYKEWVKSSDAVKAGKKMGIDATSAKTYAEFKTKWNEEWTSKIKKTVNDNDSDIMRPLIEAAIKKMQSSNPYWDPQQPISHYVCAHKDGTPYVDKNGKYVYLYTAYNNGSKESVNSACSANLPIRPTIDGGYFGHGYSSEGITDTRHVSKNRSSILQLIPLVGDIQGGIQGFSTRMTSLIAQIVNEMLNLSFSPLMDQLGITTIVKTVFVNLRDSTFYPLIGLVIAYAAVMMFVDVLKTQSLKKFLATLLMMLIVFLSAVVVFSKPDTFIDKTEEIPLTFETAITDTLLNSGTSDSICETNASDSTGARSAQCYIWKDLIFNTWTYGQFGTGYSNLYPNNSYGKSHGKHLNNANEELVGNPEVNMGGGKKVSNWALYQYSLLTSGTITTEDSVNIPGVTDRNLYRLVDLQAGPHNASQSDNRYWTAWTGRDSHRTMIAMLGFVISVLALIAVGGLLITKIELTFLMSVMVLGLPIILLFGLTPKGQLKLKGYLATLFSLFLKRILMVTLLCVLLKMLDVTVSSASGSYYPVFVGSAVILLFFIFYKPEILNLFHFEDEDLFGGSGLMSGNPDEVKRVFKNYTPLYIKNKIYGAKARIKGNTSGVVGNVMGSVMAARNKVKEQMQDKDFIQENNLNTFSKRTKYAMKQSIVQSARNMKVTAKDSIAENTEYETRRADNFMTRTGLSGFERFNRIRTNIEKESMQQLTNNKEQSSSTVRNVQKQSQFGAQPDLSKQFDKFDKAALQNNPKLQGKIRNATKQANKAVKNAGQLDRQGNEMPLDVAAKKRRQQTTTQQVANKFDEKLEHQADVNKIKHPIKYHNDTEDVPNIENRVERKQPKVGTTIHDLKNNAALEAHDSKMEQQRKNNPQNRQRVTKGGKHNDYTKDE